MPESPNERSGVDAGASVSVCIRTRWARHHSPRLFGIMSKFTTSLLLLACLLLAACKSPAPGSAPAARVFHDPGDRVVTVERWDSVAGFALAWAVYPDRVVVFTRNDFGKPEHLVAEQSVDASDLARIKEKIHQLPAGLIGKHFSKEGVHDGTFFRISFSPSGALTSDRIEFEHLLPPDVVPLLAAIDAQTPGEYQIHYERMNHSSLKDRRTKVENVDVP